MTFPVLLVFFFFVEAFFVVKPSANLIMLNLTDAETDCQYLTILSGDKTPNLSRSASLLYSQISLSLMSLIYGKDLMTVNMHNVSFALTCALKNNLCCAGATQYNSGCLFFKPLSGNCDFLVYIAASNCVASHSNHIPSNGDTPTLV